MKIAAVVILYHPAQYVITNIKTYYDYVDKLYVFDNTEKEPEIKKTLLELPKVEYYHNGENKGIANRLNSAANIAIDNKFSWLLTMDQDSKFSDEAALNYFNCFHTYKLKETVAMFGTEYSSDIVKSSPTCTATSINKLITSASLLNLALHKTIGGFDEELFIDSVDYEYCFRAKKAGYSLIQFSNIYIEHQIGKQVYRASLKSLYFIKKRKVIHSPIRCYYLYRNLLYLENKYPNNKDFTEDIKDYVMSHIKICFLYGRQPIKIIRYLLKAKNDFKMGKMGKIDKEL